jgi:transposase-like protein
MEAVTMPVQSRKVTGRKRWDVEQKLAVLREWKEGLPLQELCRRYGLHASQVYGWCDESYFGRHRLSSC